LIREAVQNSLGWLTGMVKPKIEFAEVALRIAKDVEAVLVGSAALAAVTVTVAGEGTAEGAV
jgi:hypothetical protein